MGLYHSYLNSAVNILEDYKGSSPFSIFLKKYFSANKKFGSRDRKQIAHLCYCYFRLGKAVPGLKTDEKILIGLYCSSKEPNEMLAALKPGWNENVSLSLDEKFSIVNDGLGKDHISISQVFPWKKELSNGVDHIRFCESFFVQPDLFIRLRPGKEETVKQKLEQAGIAYQIVSDSCLALPNSSKTDSIIELDREAVIQDHSSQRTGDFIRLAVEVMAQPVSVWDCCAASGGKSIMAYDINAGIELTVSDVRDSILANLKKRFQRAGIRKYKSLIQDITKINSQNSKINDQFSIIIADVPCSGSGTWSRTPEQLIYFDEKQIEKYNDLQQKLITNIIPHLSPGGYLIYITCSVFKKENEEIIEFIVQNFGLKVIQQEVLKGYDKKADTMFVVVLQKSIR